MAFDDAVRRARRVFEQGKALGYTFTLLDVGGGFPGTEKPHDSLHPDIHGLGNPVSFERIAATLSAAIEEVFPDRAVRVIAEPGRYYAAPSFTLATTITSRRVVPHTVKYVSLPSTHTTHLSALTTQSSTPHSPPSLSLQLIFLSSSDVYFHSPVVTGAGEDTMETSPVVATPPGRSLMYYIDDGVYGSLNCILFDHCQAMPKVLGVDGRVLAEDEEVSIHIETGTGWRKTPHLKWSF